MKKLLLTILFLVCAVLVAWQVNEVLKFKHTDGNLILEAFYSNKKPIDVLMLGSSHTYDHLNAGIMWRSEGVSAFALAAGSQRYWSSYYYLKESLKYLKPQVLIFDVGGGARYSGRHSDSTITIWSTLGLRSYIDKARSIALSVPSIDRRVSIFLGIPEYHSRYRELKEDDFPFLTSKEISSVVFGRIHTNIYKNNIQDMSSIQDMKALDEKDEEFFLKILDLAKQNDIKVLLVKSPYQLPPEHQKIYNYIDNIAKAHGVEFLNFNLSYKDVGIDPLYDFRDFSHFNVHGIKKYSMYLAKYLRENYNVPDRRNDPEYAEWDKWANDYYMLAFTPKLNTTLQEYLKLLKNYSNDVVVFTVVTDEASRQIGKISQEELSILGIDADLKGKHQYGYVSVYDTETGFDYEEISENQTIIFKDRRDKLPMGVDVKSRGGRDLNKNENTISSIKINGQEHSKNKRGLNIVIYDKKRKTVIDSFYVDTHGDPTFTIKR
ncbi:MAG: DUF1574 domain-containing protein [Deferribacteraceae bacterium]|jgi:hypothetical protein|nr:DUF1574 domain-containing protein [Deferribacteraceae bacterium]